MPKLPRGLIKRGRTYYARTYEKGTEKRTSLRTKDYNEACDRLKRVRLGQTVEEVPEVGQTVGELGTQWIESHVAANRSERNTELVRRRFDRFQGAFFGPKTPLSNLRSWSLERFKAWLRSQKKANGKTISEQTQSHILADTKCFIRWLSRNGIQTPQIPGNFVIKAQELEPKGFSETEAKTLKSLEGDFGYTCRLLLATGLRWGEAVRATAEDVKGGCLVITKTKTGKLRRVPLPPQILQELIGRKGTLIPFTNPISFARKVRRRSGIETFHVHRCRHHYAIDWLQKGGNISALSKALGHSTVTMTERYAKISDAYVRDEALRVWSA